MKSDKKWAELIVGSTHTVFPPEINLDKCNSKFQSSFMPIEIKEVLLFQATVGVTYPPSFFEPNLT